MVLAFFQGSLIIFYEKGGGEGGVGKKEGEEGRERGVGVEKQYPQFFLAVSSIKTRMSCGSSISQSCMQTQVKFTS